MRTTAEIKQAYDLLAHRSGIIHFEQKTKNQHYQKELNDLHTQMTALAAEFDKSKEHEDILKEASIPQTDI